MSRTLLQGPAGSGKTAHVLDAVAPLLRPEAGGRFRRFLVLVPTYSQAEHLKRRLIRRGGAGAAGDGTTAHRTATPAPQAATTAPQAGDLGTSLLDRGVVTFEQLAERRTGWRLQSLAPAAVRDAILAAAFEDAAQGGEGAFEGVARFAGFRRAALRFLDEVKALEVDPARDVVEAAAERLGAVAGVLPGRRGEAVRGLARVLALYESRRRAEGLRDHGDLVRELLRLLREGRGDASRLELFAMDGFTDLTPVQAAIVHLLADTADASVATVLGDPAAGAGSPFAASAGLVERLVAGGFRVETVGPGSSRASWRLGGDLARVERKLAGADVPSAPPDGSVRFLAGADPDDEADRVARTVLGWTTDGVPRAEILVVVRSLASGTAARVVEALARHGVPAQRFGGEPVLTVPCVRSALRIVRLLAVPSAEELVAAVRQGDLRGVEDGDADRLGELVRERGAATEDAVLALARDEGRGAPTVLDWHERLRARRPGPLPRPPAALAEAALAALPDLLRLRFLAPFDDADEDSVARDAAAMRALRDLAGDLVRALRASGRSAVAPAAFAEALADAAEHARFARRDPRDDAVHVVDAEEARQWEARAVVVAGLRTGEFPAAAREDLFLSDEERAAVERTTGMRLPNRLDEALRRERLLFYAAATRATERLVVTCPVADDAGNPVLRSPFLDLAMEILPRGERVLDGADRSPGDVRPAPGETFHASDLERTALAALTERFAPGGDSEIRPHTGWALLPRLVAGPDSVVAAAARWFRPREPSLAEGGAARAAMARPRARSASSLADFAQCPFRHFARKGLALDEPAEGAEDGVSAMLAGDIAHQVLETAGNEGVRDADGVAAIFDGVWRVRTAAFRRDLRFERERTRLRRALRAFAEGGGLRGVAEGFAPQRFEWKFGMGGAPGVSIGTGDAAVALVGAADRIDVDGSVDGGAGDGGRAIVVDYKWSDAWRYAGIGRKIEEGTDLQLPIYALAAQELLGRRVVAVGYVTLRDDGRKWLPVTEDAPVGGRNPPAGWGVGDGSAGLADAAARIVRLDAAIRSGDCRTAPRDEDRCGSRCPFADVCRFEGEPGTTPELERTP